MIRQVFISICAVVLLMAISEARACPDGGCRGSDNRATCGSACSSSASGCSTCAVVPTQPQYVQQTCYVPTMVMETRTVTCTKCRPETREQLCVSYRTVWETKVVQCEHTTYCPKTEVRTVSCPVQRTVYETVQKQYTVMVPQTEMRQYTRTVCHMVPVTETRTICETTGHWECRVMPAPAACGCAPACAPQRVCRYWVPETVQRQVQVTCMHAAYESVPYQCAVTVCRPEVRTCPVQVCKVVTDMVPHQVTCCRYVPVRNVVPVQVCAYRTVPESHTQLVTVMVPYQEQHEIQVAVCKMVAQTVNVPVCPNRCASAPCGPVERRCCH
jgi:hypothetical protein